MTVYIEKPAVNLREELASLRNQGGYQEQQFYFDGLVTNGTFDTDLTGWVVNGFTFSAGTALSDGSNGSLRGEFPVTIGTSYEVSFTVSGTTVGELNNTIGGAALPPVGSGAAANGTFTSQVVATSSAELIFNAKFGFDGAIDNVAVFETDGTDVIHTMPKGWVPLHVYEDGLLQREGAANDYEVVYDGFDYVIKPAVAPSPTTQTCVIGVRK